MLIKEQMRKYKVKMEEINQLEAAESMAVRRLSLLRQNAVSCAGRGFGGAELGRGGAGAESHLSAQRTLAAHILGHSQPDLGPHGSMVRGRFLTSAKRPPS